ncbi:MAG: proline--tRNA ligase [Peptococcaceae bacterium]
MRATQLLAPTLRENPAEAEITSHQLLVRAGFIRKVAAGIYTYLPLAWQVIKKISKIVREEMDRAGGQEILMPIIQPAEIWYESGRWEVYGPELFRLQDRHNRDFCLGPTHEEIITDLIRNEVNSYRQLPLYLYQIQNKYRDEKRPRFGLMRGREFIMKDLYSFDRDEAGLENSYQKMFQAYLRIFKRCGLQVFPVEAEAGAIGGRDTHEFMVLAEAGEATIVFCSRQSCGYASNVEKAVSPVQCSAQGRASYAGDSGELLPLKEVHTPNMRTVEEITAFLNVPAQRLIKSLLYETEKGIVAALIRGDRELNEVKLQKVLDVQQADLAGAETVERITKAGVGFTGPVSLEGVQLVADPEVMAIKNAVSGANKNDTHLVNVNAERDFKPGLIADLRLVKAGDLCPDCLFPLKEAKGIEVGQTFKLGEKYSRTLGANYLDENGRQKPLVMGCYGIGITRTMAAVVEQSHDENGIIWPVSIAPFHAVIIPVNQKDSRQVDIAESIYNLLKSTGIEVVLDDRPERAGVKFKDADLIGYPWRIVVGNKAVENGKVELRNRATKEEGLFSPEEIVGVLNLTPYT